MTLLLTTLLRLAGLGLILLAIMHVYIARELRWREELVRLSPVNASIFYVHSFFICLVLVTMGLPCLLEPVTFLEPSRAGAWLTWSFAGFWMIRLFCQFFVYAPELWRGKARETRLHYGFGCVCMCLTLLFAKYGCVQSGWLVLKS
jgi:hypothetical protein